jgi:hypothetical protein
MEGERRRKRKGKGKERAAASTKENPADSPPHQATLLLRLDQI